MPKKNISASTSQPAPNCPRCGYDLSVTVEQWPSDRCPLTDTCTECGLTVEWRKVLGDEHIPKWMIEHSPRRVRTWLSAVLVPLVPWKAMREADMAHTVRPLPLALCVLALVVLHYFTIAGGLIAAEGFGYGWSDLTLNDTAESLLWFRDPSSARAIVPSMWWRDSVDLVTGAHLLMLAMMSVYASCFLLMGETLSKLKVRKQHLVRLWCLGLLPVLGLSALYPLVRSGMLILKHADLLPRTLTQLSEWFESQADVPTAFVVFMLWSLIYWWAACRWYLKIRWAFFHTLMFSIIVWLFAASALFYLSAVLNS